MYTDCGEVNILLSRRYIRLNGSRWTCCYSGFAISTLIVVDVSKTVGVCSPSFLGRHSSVFPGMSGTVLVRVVIS